jgi:hypothetical protein
VRRQRAEARDPRRPVGGLGIAELAALPIGEASKYLGELELSDRETR